MDESHWPARNVAEYAYCPRLFYFMQVEGVFLPSRDTVEGLGVHKRVDKPSAKKRKTAPDEDESDPDKPETVRSLVLTSETLDLTATLDLAEITGKSAVPVEYRKGRPKRLTMAPPPDDPSDAEDPPLTYPEPWPTDRVQVGLQALLLEDAGYTVDKAIIYYASEKLRLTVAVDEALKKEALDTLKLAQDCAKGTRPLPLVNDSRCPKCSLQPFCLPDEVNYQRAEAAKAEELSPRKIWPPRDDGIHVVTQQEGLKVGVRGQELRVTDREGATRKTVPLANIESLSLLGSVQISTQAIGVLAGMNIPIAFLSPAGRLIAMIDPLDSVSSQVRTAQVQQLGDPEVCLELTRALVCAKIANQRTLLMRNHCALPEQVAREMAKAIKAAALADTVDSIRGFEGQAASLYFGHFAGMLKSDLAEEFDANGRKRRPPPDPVNACLSLAYSMLAHECVAALRTARLEPSIGGFHVSRPGRPALALDLMEPFRPLIADSVAITCFNRGDLTDGHFMRTASGVVLTDAGRRAFFSALGNRMDTEINHPVFDYRLSYRRMIVLHARMISAWLCGEIPSLSFLTTR